MQSSAFIDGNVSNLWLVTNLLRTSGGLEPLSNQQSQVLWTRGDGGESSYAGFFFTLRKRMSRGLAFTANYTLSTNKDQAGRRQNSISAQSTPFDNDVDWGPAFADRRHVANVNWLWDLPFYRGGNELIGRLARGWYVSGIFTASSGVPLDVCQSRQAYGGGLAFAGCSGAIPVGDLNIESAINRGVAGSGGVGTVGDPSNNGTGLNLFADPESLLDKFRSISLSQDARAGRGTIRGLPRWNVDLSIGKTTPVRENVRVVFTADFINLFNNVQYNNPSLNLTSPATFGVLRSQGNTPRAIQLALRLEF
jgi:hypothetical protein